MQKSSSSSRNTVCFFLFYLYFGIFFVCTNGLAWSLFPCQHFSSDDRFTTRHLFTFGPSSHLFCICIFSSLIPPNIKKEKKKTFLVHSSYRYTLRSSSVRAPKASKRLWNDDGIYTHHNVKFAAIRVRFLSQTVCVCVCVSLCFFFFLLLIEWWKSFLIENFIPGRNYVYIKKTFSQLVCCNINFFPIRYAFCLCFHYPDCESLFDTFHFAFIILFCDWFSCRWCLITVLSSKVFSCLRVSRVRSFNT